MRNICNVELWKRIYQKRYGEKFFLRIKKFIEEIKESTLMINSLYLQPK
jgi:hypothetical protein